jgi:photosystem II stability/assembly factor-like uncharacterized protein
MGQNNSSCFKRKWEVTAAYYMHFPDLMHGYILITAGSIDHPEKTIYATTDGGLNWIRVSDITGQFKNIIKNIYFRNVNEGWISTYTFDNTNKTEDSGETWEPVQLQIPDKYKNSRYAVPEIPFFLVKNKMEV